MCWDGVGAVAKEKDSSSDEEIEEKQEAREKLVEADAEDTTKCKGGSETMEPMIRSHNRVRAARTSPRVWKTASVIASQACHKPSRLMAFKQPDIPAVPWFRSQNCAVPENNVVQ